MKKLNFLTQDGVTLEEEFVGKTVYVAVERSSYMDENRAKFLELNSIHPSWKSEKQLLYYTSDYPVDGNTIVVDGKFYKGETQHVAS